jgi:5-methylcytosine-specific restriction endonuclease McrA
VNSFEHARRGSMTAQRVLRIFQANEGKCYRCQRKLGPRDGYDIDHIIALENGGTDDDANLAPCCDWCHTEKSADDHSQAGHGRRMAAKAFVPAKFRRSKSWAR